MKLRPLSFFSFSRYALASPARAALPYVYDHFEWDHCVGEGYDFGALFERAAAAA